jgi:hypothetical protein
MVTLTVTDDSGLQSQTTQIINVTNPLIPITHETGVISGVSEAWQAFTLNNSYASMAVVAAVNLPSRISAPGVVRIRNALGNSFDVRVQNPSGDSISGYDVHYFVVEEGVYTAAIHGVAMEAVRVTSSITAENNNWQLEPRAFQNSYASPVVAGQVVTENDPAWSVFWASGTGRRNDPPNASGFSAGKNVGEDSDVDRASETISYVVMESGTGAIGSTKFFAGLSADSVVGVGDSGSGSSVSYGPIANPAAAIVSASGMNGSNGGWPILYGSNPVSSTSITLAFDEDQIKDSERDHITEEVGYIVFGSP